MATVHDSVQGDGGLPPYRSGPPARRRGWIVLALAMAGALLLGWFWHVLGERALPDAAYGARVACSCRYVGGRDFGSCANEIDRETAFVFLSDDAESKTVTALVPLLARQQATYVEGAGCMLERWED